MCEKLLTGRAQRSEPVPGPESPGSALCVSMPIFCKVRAAGPGRGLTVLRICADISHFAVCRNRRKSKWRNRRRAGPGQAGTGRRAGSATVRYWLALALLLDDSWWGSGPIQIADPGMWKWLTADQVDREIPFLQHLWWIVSGSCSVFLWQGNAGGMRQPQGPACSLRGLLNIERDSPCQLNSDSHLSRSGSQLFLTFRHKIRKNTQILPSLYVAQTGLKGFPFLVKLGWS